MFRDRPAKEAAVTLGDALPASRWRFPLLTREEIFRDRGKVPRPRKPPESHPAREQ